MGRRKRSVSPGDADKRNQRLEEALLQLADENNQVRNEVETQVRHSVHLKDTIEELRLQLDEERAKTDGYRNMLGRQSEVTIFKSDKERQMQEIVEQLTR